MRSGSVYFAAAIAATPLAAAALNTMTPDAGVSPKDKGPQEKITQKITAPTKETPGQTTFIGELLDRMKTGDDHGQTLAQVNAGGGTAGAISAGSACALQALDGMMKYQDKHGNDLAKSLKALETAQSGKNADPCFNTTFKPDTIYTSSVGSLVMLYQQSGNVLDGSKIFPTLGTGFLNKAAFAINPIKEALGIKDNPPPMNLSMVENIVTGKDGTGRGVNTTALEGVTQSKEGPHIFVVATDPQTLQPVMIKTKGMSAEELIKTAVAGCELSGIGDYKASGSPDVIDALYSGENTPLNLGANAADKTLVLGNEPIGGVNATFGSKLMSQFVLFCGVEKAPGFDKLIKAIINPSLPNLAAQTATFLATEDVQQDAKALNFMMTANKEAARNAQEVAEARGDDSRVLFLGTPPGDPSLSSSELNTDDLTSATQRAYLNTMAVAIRDGINYVGDDGEKLFNVAPNTTLKIGLPGAMGTSSLSAVVKVDKQGHATSKIVETVKEKIPAKKEPKKKPSKNPFDIEKQAIERQVAQGKYLDRLVENRNARRNRYEDLKHSGTISTRPMGHFHPNPKGFNR